MTYTVRITPHLNETYEVGREGKNDDLVCALAMAAWMGENLPGPFPDPRQLVLNDLPGDEPTLGQTGPARPKTRLELLAEDHPHLFRD